MQEHVAARLEQLRQEYQTGQQMLASLEAQQLDLQQTLLRLSGAIQVLEELLTSAEPPAAAGGPADAADRPAGEGLVEAHS
jgi:hypothetical protein